MPLVSAPCSPACRGERLARATSGPDGSVVRPSGEAEGIRPAADACEEMMLGVSHKFFCFDIPGVSHKFFCFDIPNIPPIDHALWD
jgi:hypothetical protein